MNKSNLKKKLLDSIEARAPSEESIEIEWRRKLYRENKLFFLGGKQEFIKVGYFNEIDISVSNHMSTNTEWKTSVRGGAR